MVVLEGTGQANAAKQRVKMNEQAFAFRYGHMNSQHITRNRASIDDSTRANEIARYCEVFRP